MSVFKTVAKNTLLLTFSEIFIKALSFFWIIYLARTLSVELYGRYSFINSFISIFSFLPDLGVGLIVIREIAKKKEKAPVYLGDSFVLNGILAVLTFLIIISLGFVFSYPIQIRILLFITSITLFFSTLRSVGIFYFDGKEKMNYSATLNSLNSLFLIGGGLTGLILERSLIGIFVGMLIGTVVSLLITWSKVLKFTTPRFIFGLTRLKKLLLEGLPLGLASFSFLIYSRIDSVLLNSLLGERHVGIYNSATPFVFSLIQLLNVPFVVAMYPAISRLSVGDDREKLLGAVKKSLFFIASWSIPLAIGVSFFSPMIIPLVFGSKYNEAIPILRVLIFFVPFASLSAFLYKLLIALNRQYIYLFVSILGAVFNVILNFLLIPKLGTYGAATTSVITQMLLFVIYLIVGLRLISVKPT